MNKADAIFTMRGSGWGYDEFDISNTSVGLPGCVTRRQVKLLLSDKSPLSQDQKDKMTKE